MNYDQYIEKISEELLRLEDQGEIVITSTVLNSVSKSIFISAIEPWIQGHIEDHDPIESSIPCLLEDMVTKTMSIFSLEEIEATKIVNEYYKQWLLHRSQKEIAEIFWHETTHEMARRAYYTIHLGNEDSRDLEYLEWRKQY